MVTTRSSWEYTSYALKSFFRKTPLNEGEQVFLIDNDESFEEDASWFSPKLEIIKNRNPRSFAANVNQVMEIAKKRSADLFFLNNDVIFTDEWITPIQQYEGSAILSPLSNREVQYEIGNVKWSNTLKLSEYLGKEAVLREVVKHHKQKAQGWRSVISLPFFCVKIPFDVYSAVGTLDESYGRGGAEDNDYCLRACLAGFEIKYALSSYVLHFSGKSTWAGGETPEETAERCERFRAVFEEKWGPELAKLIIDADLSVIEKDPQLVEFAKAGDYKSIITKLAGAK
ncbi:MAG: glycosyltransferase family 2 protein [Deltaproteobacteria bacterium]|nr:glycosyltransferase family 2 protein [Deltaproteobacteria bacterium]